MSTVGKHVHGTHIAEIRAHCHVSPRNGGTIARIEHMGFPSGSDGKESACRAGDPGSIPGSGRSPGRGNGNPLQYSFWRIPWAEEPGRLQSMGSQRVCIEQLSFIFHFHFSLKVMSVYFPISTFNFRNVSHKPCLHNIQTTKQFR